MAYRVTKYEDAYVLKKIKELKAMFHCEGVG
jgi:hypothetical protein